MRASSEGTSFSPGGEIRDNERPKRKLLSKHSEENLRQHQSKLHFLKSWLFRDCPVSSLIGP